MNPHNVLLVDKSEPSDIVTCLQEMGISLFQSASQMPSSGDIQNIDLIIYDCDGAKGSLELDKTSQGSPAVLVVGSVETKEKAFEYLDKVADEVLIRPFDPLEAQLRISRLLKNRRKQSTAKLPEQTEHIRYEKLLDLSMDIILTVSNGIITFANKTAETLLHVKEDGLEGTHITSIAQKDWVEAIEEVLPELAETGDRLPIQLLGSDGRAIHVLIGAVAIEEEGPNTYMVEAVDRSEHKQALENLLQRERRYRSLVELSSNMVFVISDGVITFTNPTCDQLLNSANDPDGLVGRPMASIVDIDYVPLIDGLDELAELNERLPLKFRSLDGTLMDVIIGVAHMDAEQGESLLVEAVDISQQKKSAEALLEREERLSGIVDNAPDAIITMDEAGNIESFNNSAETIFGFDRSEAVEKNIFDFIQLLDLQKDANPKKKIKECSALEATGIKNDGNQIDIDLSIKSMIFGEHQRYIAIIRDVTTQKRDHEELAFLATHDPLTKLPNSHFILKTIERFTESPDSDTKCSVLFITLERLNRVNDLFGHQMVDHVLSAVANRLNETIGTYNIIGRWGGGKFVAITMGLSHDEIVNQICNEVEEALSTPFNIDDNDIVIGCTIGISCYPEDCDSPAALVKNAGMAAFAARQNENTPYLFYSKEMEAEAEERDMLERELRLALEHDQLEVYYQPKIDLSTGFIKGMEALVRWIHPDLGFISPVKFIPIAEETGQIVTIGEWILRRACQDTKDWIDQGATDLKVAVNLSGRQFDDESLLSNVKATLDETGLKPTNLELEVTESSLMRDVDQGMRTLKELRDLGITTAIDDFGTGYSSLSYLRRIPLDTLKIDQSFVRNLHVDPDDAAIARTIMDMAENLGLKVVAEGIEIAEHEEFLKTIHCHIGQGYYYSKPVPSHEFDGLLQKFSPLKGVVYERRVGVDRRRYQDRRV
ncbi:putative Diguanylate cyclase [Candidatus Terasakiella magnetica]|uniref:Putative Diguanylate cyclase n=1 Tax=Candidatus Terasakiella magnetica TaxID=1867952 RepID=A0A1C3RBX9_9PROT|nr:EAL domain-containing protein [Candidatus Terasakiella magnetica]SCA54771.1 putative Diguanylate cyclase [Candidatus Terasakiella magnetica]